MNSGEVKAEKQVQKLKLREERLLAKTMPYAAIQGVFRNGVSQPYILCELRRVDVGFYSVLTP